MSVSKYFAINDDETPEIAEPIASSCGHSESAESPVHAKRHTVFFDCPLSYNVYLHMYDITAGLALKANSVFGKKIDAIWHTGIVVYGKEYFFEGGITCCEAAQTRFGTPVRALYLGSTTIQQSSFEEWTREVEHTQFGYCSYHLIDNNCNHFTNLASMWLTKNPIPRYIVEQPAQLVRTPIGMMFSPVVNVLMKKVTRQLEQHEAAMIAQYNLIEVHHRKKGSGVECAIRVWAEDDANPAFRSQVVQLSTGMLMELGYPDEASILEEALQGLTVSAAGLDSNLSWDDWFEIPKDRSKRKGRHHPSTSTEPQILAMLFAITRLLHNTVAGANPETDKRVPLWVPLEVLKSSILDKRVCKLAVHNKSLIDALQSVIAYLLAAPPSADSDKVNGSATSAFRVMCNLLAIKEGRMPSDPKEENQIAHQLLINSTIMLACKFIGRGDTLTDFNLPSEIHCFVYKTAVSFVNNVAITFSPRQKASNPMASQLVRCLSLSVLSDLNHSALHLELVALYLLIVNSYALRAVLGEHFEDLKAKFRGYSGDIQSVTNCIMIAMSVR